ARSSQAECCATQSSGCPWSSTGGRFTRIPVLCRASGTVKRSDGNGPPAGCDRSKSGRTPAATAGDEWSPLHVKRAAPTIDPNRRDPSHADAIPYVILILLHLAFRTSASHGAQSTQLSFVRVHLKIAGVASLNPLLSIARTWNVCVPRLTEVYVRGLAHEVKFPASSRHSKPATGPLSDPVNRRVTVLDVVSPPFAIVLPRPSMALAIAVSGGTSTVNEWRAGLPSRLPERSTARTSKSCRPTVRFETFTTLGHDVKGAASRRHSNPATPTSSVPAAVNVTELESVMPPLGMDPPFASIADTMEVSGGVISLRTVISRE